MVKVVGLSGFADSKNLKGLNDWSGLRDGTKPNPSDGFCGLAATFLGLPRNKLFWWGLGGGSFLFLLLLL